MKSTFSLLLFCIPLVFLGTSVRAADPSIAIKNWCSEVQKSVSDLKWKVNSCEGISWIEGGKSVKGRPLVYATFGDPQAENTTLVFSTVHGDEVTPLYIALQLAQWLKERQGQLIKTRVVIAPLVNPDGFFHIPKTRVNENGVDINRNLKTHDWDSKALPYWKTRYRGDRRRNPGPKAGSEPETIFTEELIRRVKPQKILSIHSPLNFLDYDGPTHLSLSRFPKQYVMECDRLRRQLKATSSVFYPGSLGNFAGQEMGIPTLTLELPSADPKKADAYWKKFAQGIRTMIQFTVPNYATLSAPSGS
jgi:protein MpaA